MPDRVGGRSRGPHGRDAASSERVEVVEIVEVEAGMFGDLFEQTIQEQYGMTMGHWPSSFAISTVGGWIACRGAGQLSTRYGKVEDMVYGMDVVLADGRLITVGGYSRAAIGPDLQQLFVGSEGTLGLIVEASLKLSAMPMRRRWPGLPPNASRWKKRSASASPPANWAWTSTSSAKNSRRWA